jgi:uncharacterized protein (TIGR03435 family)
MRTMIPFLAVLFSAREVSLWRTINKTAALLALAFAAALPAWGRLLPGESSGQAVATAPSKPQTSAPPQLEFEVASVRPSSRKFVFEGWDFLNPASSAPPPPGGLFSWNVPVGSLIAFAYRLQGPQLASLPKWAQMQGDWYTIEARAEGSPTRDDLRQMVRSLLEKRLQFAAHFEKREGQVYALVVSRPGLGLKPHPDGPPCTLSPSQVNENNYPHVYPSYKAYPAHCGVFNRQLSHFGERRLEMLDVTVQQIADALGSGAPMSGGVTLSVLDKTGLTGSYDAVRDFGPDSVSPNADSSDEIGLPPFTVALQKQLGLKLVRQNATVDIFVIDHIGTRSEN